MNAMSCDSLTSIPRSNVAGTVKRGVEVEPRSLMICDLSPPGYRTRRLFSDCPLKRVKWKFWFEKPRYHLPLPMVSARSVKIGPRVLLTGNSAPVVGSVLTITPEAGDDKGMIESAVAMLAFRALFTSTKVLEML